MADSDNFMKLIYVNQGGEELANPTPRELSLLSRRSFIRRSSLFLPLSWFGASLLLRPQKAAANSTIINRTISAASQNAISMSNATWGRPVTIPASWNKIRIGFRAHMVNTGANLTGQPTFAFGFNSGTTLQYGDATTQNFVGCAFDNIATWTYSATGTSDYSWGSAGTGLVARTRIGTTTTDGALISAGGWQFNSGAGASSADRQINFLDVTKGSPNFTLKMAIAANTGGICGDVSASNFLLYMGQTTPVPSESGYNGSSLSSPTLAVSEGSNGTLNAINFYWNRADTAFEICDIAVAVLS